MFIKCWFYRIKIIIESNIKTLIDYLWEKEKKNFEENLSNGFEANAKLDAHIDDLTFNFKNGSFAKNKDLKGNLLIVLDKDKKNIAIQSDAFEIGKCLFHLKANFGNITISSLPEVGMQIYLNNQNTGKTTPATLPKISSGKHTVKLLNEWYEPIEKEVEVKDGSY